MKLKEISTVGMSREEWLEHRRRTIGGSDAAALLGLNRWSSPLSVYMDKKGIVPPKEDNLAMRLGREFEDVVAKLFEEQTGKKVRRKNAILYNESIPFAHANVDRLIVGENAVLECKTTSELNLHAFKNGLYPDRYYVQVLHYLMVLGPEYKRAYIAVLVGNHQFLVYTVERDEEEIATLRAVEEAFYNDHLLPSIPPEPIGTEPDDTALNAAYPADEGDEEVDLSDMQSEFAAIEAAEANRKLCDEIIERAKQSIKARMETAPRGICGRFSVTWKQQTRNQVDTAALKAAYPDIDIPYKQTVSRPFSIKTRKEI